MRQRPSLLRPLAAAALLLLLGGCPTFPDSELNREGGVGPCEDRDGDGVNSCEGDCDDGQRDIFTGQTRFFETPLGARRFDYDCDGTEQPERPDVADCQVDGEGCTGEGWKDVVPACGDEGNLTLCDRAGPKCTAKNGGRAIQRCR